MNLYNYIQKVTEGGTKVLPVKFKDKKPSITGWPSTSSSDPKQVDLWFKDKNMNAAFPTGKINGFWVLDIDKKNNGYESLKKLEELFGPIVSRCKHVVRTGGGGLHLYFKLRDNEFIPSKANVLPGIDIRGEKGVIVTPFSTHENGNIIYECDAPVLSIKNLIVAEEKLILFLLNHHKEKITNEPITEIDTAISYTASVNSFKFNEGSRNTDFFKLMSAIRNAPLSKEGLIAAARAENQLRCIPPLLDDEVLRIAKSVYDRYSPQIVLEPQIHEDAFYGLAGRLIGEISKHSEASKAALLFQFLIEVGNIMGDKFYKPIGGSNIYTNDFCLIIGDTSKARKGTGLKAINFFIKKVWKESFTKRIINGVSTGEGIIWSLRDPIYEIFEDKKGERKTKLIDPGIEFKSAIFIEQEFSKLLKVGKRETNNLNEVVRDCWDREILQSLSKTQPAKATNTFISLIGHITSEEFLKNISQVDRSNGFLNRFLFCHSYRANIISNPMNFEELASKLLCMNELYCLKGFIDDSEQTEIKLSSEGQSWWDKFYNEYGNSPDGTYAEIKARTENHLIKAAMTYALLDMSYTVEVVHLKAAKAIVDYSNDTIDYIFTKQETRENNNDKKIIDFIKTKNGKATRTEISYGPFNKKGSAEKINSTRDKLTRLGKIKIVYEGQSELWHLND